jgi:hypothetical protein
MLAVSEVLAKRRGSCDERRRERGRTPRDMLQMAGLKDILTSMACNGQVQRRREKFDI